MFTPTPARWPSCIRIPKPRDAHINDKIRQQLQVLRDLGHLEFLGGGNYRLV